MGDLRYEPALRKLERAADRAAALRALSTEEVVSALAASTRESDPYLSNVLATEAHNRIARMRAVTDSMQEGVFVAGADGSPIYVNAALTRMFEAPADALLRGEVPIHVDEEKEACYRAEVADRLTRDGVGFVEYEMRRAGGARFWTEQTITPLRDAAGRLAGYVGIVRDVSEARETRERLRRKAALLDAVFAAAHDPLVVLDADLRVVRANPPFAARAGLPADALVGAPLDDALPAGPREVEDALREVVATGRASTRRAGRDGEGQAWDWHAVPLPGKDGRPAGVVLSLRAA